MTLSLNLRSSELQSDSDLDSIRNSCDVFFYFWDFATSSFGVWCMEGLNTVGVSGREWLSCFQLTEDTKTKVYQKLFPWLRQEVCYC